MLGIGIGLTHVAVIGGVVTEAPAVSAPYTARFGIGADQAAGTGAFDTALYAGTTPANGTYGAFTVSSGVITPSGAQTAGTYDVDGWPVEVISGYKAVANQTEFNAITPANAGGKTILVREAVALTLADTWNVGSADFSRATILGDGPDRRSQADDAGQDARKHFVSINGRNLKKLTFDSLNIVTGSAVGAKVAGIGITFSGGGNTVEDVYVRRCRVIASRPTAMGNYTGGVAAFPGDEGIRISGNAHRCGVYDCVVIGACATAGAITVDANGWAEVIGNHVDLFYNDGIRLSSSDATIDGGNLVTRPLSADGDTGDPHSDGLQYLGGKSVSEASAFIKGSSRGGWQSHYNDDANAYCRVRDLLVVDASFYEQSILYAAGTVTENTVWLPPSSEALPLVGTVGGKRVGSVSISGTNVLQNCVFRDGSSDLGVGLTETGNVDSTVWTAANYTSAFPNWYFDVATLPTLQNALTVIAQPAGGGAAAGKGPRVTFSGSERSSYVLSVSAPSISISGLTYDSAGFDATINTDTELNAAYWCVVPSASPTPTYREIKERRASSGVVYGNAWIGKGGTSAAISSAGTLSPATAYKLCVVQENGYSVQSSVATSTFTTDAAGITRVGVGAFAAENNAAGLTLAIPSASNGDYLVAVLVHRHGNSEPTTPSGWTLIGNGVGYSTGFPAIAVFGRVRDGTEGSTLAITTAAAGHILGFCAAYRTVSGDGAEATNESYGQTSRATPTLTATAESCILHIWATGGSTYTLPNPSDLVAAGYTPDAEWYLGAENLLSTGAGTTAARTATAAASSSWNSMQVELLKA